MRSAILCILLSHCLAAQNGASIEGIVIDSTTHKPLPGVHINMNTGALDAYGAISGKDGRFSITRIPPDDYFLSAQRNGYERLPGKDESRNDADAQVTLSPGQHRTGLVVEMTPRAAILGKVVDEYGDPVQNAHVEAVQAGQPQIVGMQTSTDERGEYRMTGLPGAYLIRVSTAGPFDFVPAETHGEANPAYAPTWYPAAIGKEQSRAVEAAAGRDVTGIDIRMIRALSFSIGGVVTGQENHSVSVNVRLAGSGSDPFFESRKLTTPGPDGRFRIPGLAPGRYFVTATDYNTLRSPRAEVLLQTADETSLVLNLQKSEGLPGSLKIDGAPPNAEPPDHLTVQLQPMGDAVPAKGGDVDREGAFQLQQVFPDRFRLSVANLPENAYVKSVSFDGVESESDVLDLSHGVSGGRVTVIVSLNGAEVKGTVTDADGKPIDSPRPFVALAMQPEDIRGDAIDRAEAGGVFRFTGVRPGKYRLAAVDGRLYSRDPAVLKKAFPRGVEIEVREGERVERNVKIAISETADAQP